MSIAAGEKILAADVGKFKKVQTGIESMSFTGLASSTLTVTYPEAFSASPNVHININSGAGSTSKWIPRAINVNSTSFQIFVFNAQGSTSTWSGVTVAWTAIEKD